MNKGNALKRFEENLEQSHALNGFEKLLRLFKTNRPKVVGVISSILSGESDDELLSILADFFSLEQKELIAKELAHGKREKWSLLIVNKGQKNVTLEHDVKIQFYISRELLKVDKQIDEELKKYIEKIDSKIFKKILNEMPNYASYIFYLIEDERARDIFLELTQEEVSKLLSLDKSSKLMNTEEGILKELLAKVFNSELRSPFLSFIPSIIKNLEGEQCDSVINAVKDYIPEKKLIALYYTSMNFNFIFSLGEDVQRELFESEDNGKLTDLSLILDDSLRSSLLNALGGNKNKKGQMLEMDYNSKKDNPILVSNAKGKRKEIENYFRDKLCEMADRNSGIKNLITELIKVKLRG
jgi:hypothetical protein